MIIEKKKRHSRNELTAKEMKFARLIAEGERKVEAYMKAYDKKKKLPATKSLAYTVSKKPRVEAQIQILKQELARKADFASTITVDRQAKLIEKAILATQEKEDWNSYLKAIDMQSKLVGIYAPDKVVTKNLHLVKEVPAGDVDV